MPFWRSNSGDVSPPRHLPLPTGPHAVGYQDLMTPGTVEEGTFMRLYYPSVHPLNETINKHDLWPLWAEDEYLIGFVKFMQAVLSKWPSWAPRGEFLFIDQVLWMHAWTFWIQEWCYWVLQVAYLAPVMHLGCTHMWRLLNGKVYCPILRNAPISKEKKWPVIVFSHGMGCSRFAYSRMCTDLASHGFLVSAVEHRDASACVTFKVNNGEKEWIPFRRITDTEKEYTVRNAQLHQRVRETRRTLDIVDLLSSGENVINALPEAELFDLSMFKDRLDLSKPVLAGHSYGGATTLLTLSQDKRFHHGLVLDGWLFPLKDEVVTPEQPIVFINTESFMNRDNIVKMKSFLRRKDQDRKLIFIKGSVHQNHIDAPLIFKAGIIKKIMGFQSDTDPVLVLDLNDKLMLHFIWNHLEIEVDQDVINFLEHHDEVLIEASDESTTGEDSGLVNITEGQIDINKKIEEETNKSIK